MIDDAATLTAVLNALDEQRVYVDSAQQRNTVAQDRWHVQVRAASKHDSKAYSYFPGVGSTFCEALRQAAVNAGAYVDRGPGAGEPKPKRKRSKEDLLA
jgi:hypothetical protein